jgi:hypothetical protein
MVRPKQSFLCFLGLALLGASLSAQVPTGKIFGTVTDEQGTPLPGVAVEATSPQLVGKAAAVTEPNGVYRLFGLTPGTQEKEKSSSSMNPVGRISFPTHLLLLSASKILTHRLERYDGGRSNT